MYPFMEKFGLSKVNISSEKFIFCVGSDHCRYLREKWDCQISMMTRSQLPQFIKNLLNRYISPLRLIFQMSGNKMNAHNLATVFGPTILRQTGGKLTQTWSENDAVIRVMETMIDRCDDLFTVNFFH